MQIEEIMFDEDDNRIPEFNIILIPEEDIYLEDYDTTVSLTRYDRKTLFLKYYSLQEVEHIDFVVKVESPELTESPKQFDEPW